jgi:hypothetical protein
MTYIRELPACAIRFGRTDIIEKGEKKIAIMIMACGYREVDPEECIMCQGFTDTTLEYHVDTFIRIVKGKSFRLKSMDRQDYHENNEK